MKMTGLWAKLPDGRQRMRAEYHLFLVLCVRFIQWPRKVYGLSVFLPLFLWWYIWFPHGTRALYIYIIMQNPMVPCTMSIVRPMHATDPSIISEPKNVDTKHISYRLRKSVMIAIKLYLSSIWMPTKLVRQSIRI